MWPGSPQVWTAIKTVERVITGAIINHRLWKAVTDPGFAKWSAHLVGGHRLPTRLHYEKFVCRNERIWTLRGARAGGAPWIRQWKHYSKPCLLVSLVWKTTSPNVRVTVWPELTLRIITHKRERRVGYGPPKLFNCLQTHVMLFVSKRLLNSNIKIVTSIFFLFQHAKFLCKFISGPLHCK